MGGGVHERRAVVRRAARAAGGYRARALACGGGEVRAADGVPAAQRRRRGEQRLRGVRRVAAERAGEQREERLARARVAAVGTRAVVLSATAKYG